MSWWQFRRPFRRPFVPGPAVSAAGKCSGTRSELDHFLGSILEIFPWLIGESSHQWPAKNRRDDVQDGDKTEEKWPFKNRVHPGIIDHLWHIWISILESLPKNLDLDFSLDFSVSKLSALHSNRFQPSPYGSDGSAPTE